MLYDEHFGAQTVGIAVGKQKRWTIRHAIRRALRYVNRSDSLRRVEVISDPMCYSTRIAACKPLG